VGAQLLLGRRDLRDALAYYDEALRRGADALDLARDRWSCAMLLGDFEAAWRISDQVLAERRRRGLACVDQPLHLRWVWDGRPLTDRNVLVRCHHGLGDVIQFIRLAAPLRATAARVTVQAVPELLPLIDGVAGIDAMIPLGATDPPYDIDIELLELPHALRFRLDGIPARVPYISAWRSKPTRVSASVSSGQRARGAPNAQCRSVWCRRSRRSRALSSSLCSRVPRSASLVTSISCSCRTQQLIWLQRRRRCAPSTSSSASIR
jgi:hypothetical protein